MRNFTFNWFKFFKPNFLVLFFLLIGYSASAQFYTKHYIAPAPWQYFSKANEIVIATNSTSTVNITLTKSDGTLETTLTAIKGAPAVYRFKLLAKDLPMNALNTVISGAGLIVTSDGPTSVNMRNVASDDYTGGENVDANLKGNAALTSFGDAGIGVRFRVGYYRDGTLGNFSSLGDQRPIYSIMATANNTTVKINNAIAATLNAGQSYLFKVAIGTLVESSNPSVMNTSAAIDMPGGCGDGAFNQVPPESVLGTEYFIERGKGNDTAEQTTVVATKDNTVLTIDTYSTTGALTATNSVTLATAGSFYTFQNGVSNTSFSASRVFADKKIVVYSGTAQSCEVDISTIAPVSECGGSNFIETAKFRNYGTGTLPYFGYILLRSATDVVTVNGTNIETISGIAARHQLGTTGWYLINFEDTQIGSPNVLSISSAAKLTVSIVQQGGGFSMAGFFSNFAVQPEDPTMTYISGGGCTNNKAELTTPAGFAPYQWYYNGTAIAGANSSTYTATKTGAYSVASTLTCGAQTQSKPVSVTLCTDLGITKTVDNAAPCLGSTVEFTVKVSNLGGNNVSGVSVNDLLPSGYTYVSSTPSVGVYDSATGIWSIGDVDAQTSVTLKITATINATGNYTNTASLPASIDTNTANNSASAAVTPKTSNLVITNPAAICAPATVDLTAPAVTAGSTPNMTLSYWTDSTASTAYTTPSAVTVSGTYYIKAVSADGCQFIKPVVVTINSKANTATITASGGTTCITGNVVLTSSGGSGTYLWSTGETTKSITVTTNGSYTVRRINAAGCPGDISAATVVTFIPAAPTASSQTFCSSENKKVSDLVATGSNLKWYSANTGGTALPTTQTLATGNYFASQTVSGCESTRTQVAVTINTISSAPVASSQTFCSSDNKKVSDLVATGTNLKWYSASSGGTLYNGTETLISGNYYVSQTANTCGESARTLVVVTVDTAPSAPTASSQTFCATDAKKVNDLVATGTNLKWYSANTGGTLYNGTETLISGNYYASQTTNSCGESARRLVAVTVNNTAAPTASSQTFCAIDAKKVSDLAATGTSLKWYSASTGGTLYTGTETLTSGNYYVSQTLNSCESTRTLVAVTVNNTAAPTASSQTFCVADAKKVSDLVATGTNLKWYSASTGGTLYTGTETLTSANYYVSQTLTGCESTRNLVSVTVNPTPSAPTITAGGPTTFCSGGSVTLTSSGGNSYLWSTGETTQSITVSASGTYSVRIANASGCQSASSTATIVTVNAIPAVPTLSAVTQPTCSTAAGSFTISNYSASNTYAVSPSTGVTQSGNTITAPAGSYTVTAAANGCTSAASSAAVINAQPATPAVPTLSAVTQPTCSTAAGSFTISNYSASNTYAVSPSTGVTQSGNTITAPAGSYTVTAAANGCTSAASSAAVINAQPATPAVPTLSAVTQPTCSTATGSFTISNYSASNTYAVSPSTGVTQSGNTITAPAGSYTVTAAANGCTSAASSAAVINAQPATPAVPTLSVVTQPTCSTAAGSFTISNYDASNTYTVSPSTGVTQSGDTVTAPAGSYTVTAATNGCTSGASSAAVINAQPAIPAVPTLSAVTQPTCSTATGSFTISNYSASNTYAVSPSTGVTQTGNTITAPAGSYTVTAAANGCTSGASSAAVINAQPATPAVPTLSAVTQPTCSTATGSFTISNYSASNTYAVSPSTGVTQTGNTITAPAGSYTLTAAANGCTSAASSAAVINAQPATPAVPTLSAVTQPTCSTATGSFTISNYSASNTYAVSPSTGVTQTGNTITAPAGSYTLTAAANGCTSAASSAAVINAQPATPAVPTLSAVTQPTCLTATGSFTISNYSASNTYAVSPSTGVTQSGNTITAPAGSYTLTAAANGCTSAASSAAVINAQPATPAVPTLSAVTQPTCLTATGSFTISNYSASNTYAVSPSTGVIQTGNTITAPAGSYTVTASANGCTSGASSAAVINVQPATPAVPTLSAVTQPTCLTATGSFTISNYDASNTYVVSPSTGVTQTGNTITAPAGSYTVTAAANGCTSAASSAAVINAQPATPAVPTLSAVTQPTCLTATGSFTISNYSASNTYAVSPSTGVIQTGNTITAPAGSYTVTASANGCTSGASSAAVINAQPAIPAVPTLSAVTQPTCSTATGSFTISNYSASNTYAVSPSTGVTQTGNTITAPAGSYTVTAAANGCTSGASSAAVINAQPATPAVPTLSAVTQPTCSTATGSFTISNYSASNTYAVSPSTGVTQTGNTITAPAGSYTLTAAANGCTSAASSAAVINAQPATPAVPTLSAVTQPTCSTATGSFTISNYSASNTYAVSPSTGVTQTGNTITAPAGSYTLTAAANGCTSAASSAAVINAQPATPAVPTLSAVTQPTCSTATGSFTISNYSASNTYAVSPSTGVTQSGNTITAPAGSYTLTAAANGCTSAASSAAVINAQPATPAVPTLSAVTQPTCLTATGSFTISNYSASNTYAVSPSTGVIQTGNTITAPAGSYTVTASANGCTSGASSAAVINVQPATPAVPTLSAVTQPTCLTATGSFTISNYDASNTYVVSPSTGVTQTGNTITAPAGSYTVTASANGCTSTASAAAVINAQPAIPAVPTLSAVTQPTCLTATGSFTISNYDASNTYAVSPSTGVTQTGNTITAPAGSYTVTASANGCTSGASSAAVINVQPATPAVPTLSAVTQPTCLTATGSFTISNYDASNTYAVSPSTGVTQTGNTITAPAGSYTVTAAANGCTSAASSAAVINAQPATPAVPTLSAVTQPTCSTATGSFTISNYSASNTYAVSPSTGVTQTGNTITAPAGSYTVTAAANGCTSAASSAAVINAQPATPAVPTLSAVTQPTCSTATGSFTISNYSASNTYAVSPSTGVTQTGNTITAPAGSYTVTAAANGCTSAASSAAVINAQPATPAVPTLSAVTQPTCSTATGSFTISNYSASNTYAVSPSTGVTQSGNTITAPAGSYTVTASANGCTSGASSAAVINVQPATPAVPTLSAVTQPTCLTATGSFTISNYDASNTYAVSPSTGVTQTGNTITAPAGSYTVTASANGCTSGASSAAVINVQPATPAVPTLSAVTQPTCLTATGSFTISNYDASNTYAVSPSTGVTQTGNTITAPAGSYTVTAAANGCTSAASSAAVINAQPATPAVPTLSAVTQPTCSTATGSFTISNYDASNTYAVSPSTGVTQTGNTITAPAGSYTVTAAANGCTSAASSAAVINAQPATPAVPTLSAVTQPTCSTATGSFTISNYSASNTYAVSPSTGVTQTGNTITAPAGSYTVTAAANGCTSAASSAAVINAQPATPAVPTLSAVTQPTCSTATGSFTISNYSASNTYAVSPSTGVTQSGNTITAPAGSYTVTASANGCTSGASSAAVINVQPATPAVPTLSAVTQPTCSTATGSFTISNYDASNTYVVSPSTGVTQTGNTITAPAGSYTVTASANGCTSGASSAAVINVQPATPAVPTLSAVTQPTCSTATGSFTISNYDASNTYVVSPSTGVTQTGNTITAPAGSYTVTASANGCTSGASSAAVINVQPATPAVPTLSAVTQPTCLTATGSFTISNYDASNTYVVSPSTGVTQTGNTITAPAGSYTVTASANGCISTVSAVAVISDYICAEDDTPSSVNGLVGGSISTIFANDKINGVSFLPADVVLTTGTLPTGITFNSNGTINVAPNTAAGTHIITYTICESTNTSICDSATVTIIITTPIIDAVIETTASVNGNTGGTTAALTANDTLNGNPVVIGTAQGNVTLTPVSVPAGLTLNTDGTVTVASNTAAGTYDVEYSICEVTNPTNCDTVISKVVVGAAVIDAVTETTTSINGNIGGTTAALTANDTLNGNPVVIGTAQGNVTLTPVIVPTGLTLNADGTVTVAPNTPAGIYDVTYSICEVTNPTNCDTVISKVVVTGGVLTANPDVIGSVTSSSSAQTLPLNVFANDTKNGTALVPSDVNLTTTTADPTGYLVLNPDGSLTLGANAPAGTYQLTYTICEKLNPTNCSSNTVSVTVGVPVIDAVTETTTSINGNTGGTTAALTANDTLNGNPAVIGTSAGQVTLTAVGTLPTGLTLNADGTVTVAPNTPAGTYDVTYSICEITNPTNCDTVISKVVVTGGVLTANPDVIGSVTSTSTSQTLPLNVFDNDTKNGTALVPSDVNLTTTTADPTGYLVLNPDGSLTLGANAPAGTYQLTYTICEKLNPSNCSSNTVSVTVGVPTPTPVIDAVTETTAAINGNLGGTTVSLITNDTLNGNPAVIGTSAGQVTLTAVGTLPTGLTLNADGTVTVAPNTPAGTYDVTYSICEITNPTNCDTVISKVVVTGGVLTANPDVIGSVTSTSTSQTLPLNVFDNDTKNGTALVPSDVNLTTTTADPTGYLVLNPDGSLTLGANAPAGTYQLTYTICEKLNPSNCSSNTVSVTVGVPTPTPVIDAVTETTAAINGNLGGTTVSLITNDTLNGNPAVIGTSAGQVTLTAVGTLPTGLTLNADGTVTVAPNTPAGTYDVTYSICEITNPTNCDTVISKVVVTGGVLAANPDVIGSVTSTSTSHTLPLNVFDNDTKNGTALVPSDVNLTTTTADPTGYLVLNPDGSLTLGANAPADTYQLTYTICEKLNPSNCSSNTVSVTVGVPTPTPVIDAVTETTAAINGNLGGTTVSLITNDTLNGNPAVIGTSAGQVTLTAVGTLPTGLTLNADGTVTVAPNTPAGTYDVTYSICEITNPTNCDTVISKVIVISGALLQAIDDVVGSVVGVNHPQTIINVFDNDKNNGLPVAANDLNLSIVTPDPTGFLTLNPDGTVTLGANAPRGTYEVIYQICEKLNPTNCSSASIKVTVDEPTMTVTASSYCSNNVPYVKYTVVADNFTPTNLLTIQWVDSANNVVATQTNLPLNGDILWPGATIDGSGNGVDWPGWINTNGQWTEGADGFEKTRPAVTMVFSLNPTVSVPVNYPAATTDCNARPTFAIKANNDTAGPIDISKGTSGGVNVFNNDTQNGSAVIPANVTLSTVTPNANLILNADGTVDIKAGTQTGTYQLTYQICDALSSSNCSQAVVTVEVLNTVIPVTPTKPIVANNDGVISVDGINGSLEFINVLDNDLLDGLAVNSADVTITNTSGNNNFEFNTDGTVNVKPNTPGGPYDITYQICEKAATTTNCASATLTVFVEVPGIAIVKTAVFNDDNDNKIANAGETITYKFVVTNTGNVPLTGVTITDPLPGVIVSGQAINLAVGESNETNFSAVYKITQTDINNGKVTNQASVKGSSAKGVVVEDISDNLDLNGDKPTVITLNGCEINVLNAFSPNGDSKNERFYIQGLECYPDNTVEIYNRWGVLVFEKQGYNNEDRVFKGYSEGRTTMKQSEGLPVGTYFYILKYKDSGSNPHEKSGYLYINK